MQGARSAAAETYQVDRRGREHRATPQIVFAVVFQQPVREYGEAGSYSRGAYEKDRAGDLGL